MAHLSAYLDTRKVSQGQMEGRGRRRGLWIDAYGLRKACKASGMTQVQVTKAIDVSQNRVSRMESGDMGATGIGSLRRYIHRPRRQPDAGCPPAQWGYQAR